MTDDRYDQLMDIIRGRRSVRRYADQPVERKLIEKVVLAATWAPSATNRQDWFFSVIESRAMIGEIADAVALRWREILEENREWSFAEEMAGYSRSFDGFREAPVVMVVSASKPSAVQKQMLGELALVGSGGVVSAAMAAQNLMLAAHSLGLAACCMGGAVAASKEISRIIGLDRKREIVCLVSLGYPDEHPAAPQRKDIAEVMRFTG